MCYDVSACMKDRGEMRKKRGERGRMTDGEEGRREGKNDVGKEGEEEGCNSRGRRRGGMR